MSTETTNKNKQTADSPYKLLILKFASELTAVKYPYQENCSLQNKTKKKTY